MAKLTTEDLLTREGRITFLAAIVSNDIEATGTTQLYTHEERIQALEMLMSVEGDQAVAGSCGGGVNCDGYEPSDEDDDEYCEACGFGPREDDVEDEEYCDGGCEDCSGVDDEDELLDEPEDDVPSDEEVSKL
jgi:hypothetical protein